jgi:hypothetical protein
MDDFSLIRLIIMKKIMYFYVFVTQQEVINPQMWDVVAQLAKGEPNYNAAVRVRSKVYKYIYKLIYLFALGSIPASISFFKGAAGTMTV